LLAVPQRVSSKDLVGSAFLAAIFFLAGIWGLEIYVAMGSFRGLINQKSKPPLDENRNSGPKKFLTKYPNDRRTNPAN
jgi:hypothetical protein